MMWTAFNPRRNNPLKAIGAAAVATLLFGALAPMAGAQTGARSSASNPEVVLEPGTVIPVKLDTELSSNLSRAGDSFHATVDDSKQAYNDILHGATVDGLVRDVTPQEGNNPGTLSLSFTRLRLADGRTVAISGSPTSLDTKNLTVNSDGVLVAKKNSKDQSLTYAGIGAGAGLLLDVLKGGKIRIEDILIGAGLGYGTGAVLKSQQKVHDVDLTPGTAMGVLLSTQTRYYHRAPAAVVTTHKSVVTTHKVITKAHKATTRRHYATAH